MSRPKIKKPKAKRNNSNPVNDVRYLTDTMWNLNAGLSVLCEILQTKGIIEPENYLRAYEMKRKLCRGCHNCTGNCSVH